ncbi:pyridoxal phosphate-dependent transferase [Thelonectria olida]|uniref:Pyridoxal phosphate-dependent transferase n=1 Tax=Thelonectria olida TaxID=1576542 RepID=A0A9P9AKT9_9HYPO|nr:pyridoxal phosphate-dependent transferase [Thelonectria olida]
MACLRHDAAEGDVILHACAHNPTGLDSTIEQWESIASLCRERKLFFVFDLAYQGFTHGIRRVPTFSKNLGLYGERVGALHIAVSRSDASPSTAATVQGHLVDLHRAFVSMALLFGCRVAVEIFRSKELQATWAADLVAMSGRIKAMRRALYEELMRLGTRGSWSTSLSSRARSHTRG